MTQEDSGLVPFQQGAEPNHRPLLCFGSCTLSLYRPYPSRRIPIHRLYRSCSVLCAQDVLKGRISMPEDVPTYPLA